MQIWILLLFMSGLGLGCKYQKVQEEKEEAHEASRKSFMEKYKARYQLHSAINVLQTLNVSELNEKKVLWISLQASSHDGVEILPFTCGEAGMREASDEEKAQLLKNQKGKETVCIRSMQLPS